MRRYLAPLALFAFSSIASASIVTFTGQDLNAGPAGPFPNSSTAAASFDAAASLIGGLTITTFETSPLGAVTSLAVTGATITGSGGTARFINNTPDFPTAPALDGFNTTSGGAKYLEEQGGAVTFTFNSPVQYFGAYLTGIQTNFFADSFTFSDGSIETILVPGTGTTSSIGVTDFVGFTDVGASITSVSINTGTSGQDFIGVDDVRIQSSSAPEPATFAIAGAGAIALFLMRRKRA